MLASKFQRQFWGFRPCLAEIKYRCRWNFDAICHSSRDISISGLGVRIAIFGCRSLSQSFGGTFFELVVVENPWIAVGISTVSIIVPEKISTSGLGGHIAISSCLSFSQSLSLNSPCMVDNSRVQLETNKFVVRLLKLVGAIRVRKNRSAIRELFWPTALWMMWCFY